MKILVAGAGGALGGHLVKRLLKDGHQVAAVDIKRPGEWWQEHAAARNFTADLSRREECILAAREAEWVFNLAADMGGIGYITSHHAAAMASVLINTHLLQASVREGVQRYWYASSACVYAADKQADPEQGYQLLKEEDAYPALPEAGYGEEKLFSEQMCRYFGEDEGLDVRIARMHNVYATHSTWTGGREKAPAALCRKVAEAKLAGEPTIEIWGDGTATRSFLYVDDWVDGALHIMESEYRGPINLGSEEVVTVEDLARICASVAGVELRHEYNTDAPVGVAGRGSDNALIRQVTGWEPNISLYDGISRLYPWVEEQVRKT